MTRRLSVIAALLPLHLACNDKQAAEDNAAINASLEAANKVALAKNEAWRRRIIAARHDVVPRPDLGACTAHVDKQSMTIMNVDELLREAGVATSPPASTAVYQIGSLEKATSPRTRIYEFESKMLKERKGRFAQLDGKTRAAQAKAMADPTTWLNDVSIVFDIDEKTKVDVTTGTFKSGLRVGRIYVYDYATDAVVCAGVFAATNTDSLDVKYKPGEEKTAGNVEAQVDLDNKSMEAAYDSLVMAGPSPKAAADGGSDAAAADSGAADAGRRR